MAPHVHRLSSYASQHLVRLFEMLSRKNAKLAEIKNDKMQIIDSQLKDDDKLPEYTNCIFVYRLLEDHTGNTKCNPDLCTAKPRGQSEKPLIGLRKMICDGGGRKLATACKGYYFDVSMSNIDINKLYDMEDAYEAIKTRNLEDDRVEEARLQTLITKFENMKMLDNGTIDEYTAKLSGPNIPTGIMTQVEEDDVAHTHEVVAEVVVGQLSKPRFGDGSCVSIKGKGSILFHDKNKEQKLLKDVYYIPSLRSNVITLGQATISSYDISIRGTFTVLCNDIQENGTNKVVNEEANPHSYSVTVHNPVLETNPKSKKDKSGSDDMSILIAQLETIQLLIALAARRGWKIHHLDVKTAFLNGDRKKLDSTLKMMSCLRYILHTHPDLNYSIGVQTTVALSSCEAKFMAATAVVCQAIWLRDVLAEVTENKQVIVEHVFGENQRSDPLTKALARIRFMNYLEEQTDGEAMINSIKNGDQPLPRVTQVSIAGTSSTKQPHLKDKSMWSDQEKKIQKIDRLARTILIQGLPNDIYSLIDSNKIAKDLWDALARHMLGSEYVINDLKKCGYSKDNCELNFKFLNNLQPKWKQYATMMRENKNLMDINIDALYNILKQTQRDVNDAMGLKKKTVVVSSDPLALIAEKTKVSKRKEKVAVSSDSEGSDEDDFSELKKVVVLLGKSFNRKKFYSKPTNNNLRTSSASNSANKKQEYVKSDDKKEDKKVEEKKRDMSKVKCYNCKKRTLRQRLHESQEDHAWMESSSDSDQKINANMVFMAQIEKVLSDSKKSLSSSEDTIAEVSYYTSESKSESEYKTSEYYDNSTTYGLFVDNNDDQEIFHDSSEIFSENLIESQIDHNESDVTHNDFENVAKLINQMIKEFDKKIAKYHKRLKKANQQCNDFENQNKYLKDKYDVLKNQATTFEEKNNELNEQIKVLIEKNTDLLTQTNVLKEKLKVKHVVIDTYAECQEKYAKLEAERYEYMIRYSAYFDNDKQHRKQIADQETLFDKMSYQAKDLRPTLYDEKVINLGYTSRFLTHSDEALEIEKFKRARENKIEFAYDYGDLNASYVNEKINFLDDYFQEIMNPDFDKIDSSFQQTSSLKPYVPTVILEKIIIDLEDEVVSLLAKEKENLETIESLKSKDLDTLSSVRRPKPSGVMWQKKGSSNIVKADLSFINHSNLNKNVKRYNRKDLLSCNNSHIVDTKSEYDCNAAMHADCNSYDVDVNDLFVFDDVNIRKSQIVQICLWIIDLGCSKHMTGNRALLTNFVEKFLGTYAVVIVWSEPLFMQKNTIVCLKLRNADVSGNRQTNCVKWIQHEREDMRVRFNPLTKALVTLNHSQRRCLKPTTYVHQIKDTMYYCNSSDEDVSHILFSCPLAVAVSQLVCRWWDVGWTSLGSYSEQLSWFNAIRLGSKVKCLFEGVLYVTWWCLWNFRNQSIFSVQKPRRAVNFDDIVTRSFLGVPLDVIVLLVGIVGVSILFCFLNAENEMGINIDSPIPFSSTNKHENALPFHFLLSIPPLLVQHEVDSHNNFISIIDNDNTSLVAFPESIRLLMYHVPDDCMVNVFLRSGISVVGFGVCTETSDVKLVMINTSIPTHWVVKVFASSSRAWTSVSFDPPFESCDLSWKQESVNGFIYWLGYDNVGLGPGISACTAMSGRIIVTAGRLRPPEGHGISVVDFGVCAETSDVKLVMINTSIPTHWVVKVFASSSRAWTSVSFDPPFESCDLSWKQESVNGFIYWLGYDNVGLGPGIRSNLIVSFDLKSEMLGRVHIPDILVHSKYLGLYKRN
uniref:RNA-directed DNA polymerase, eukaryota n=1 Tax=Tanacetum cinerariifolium TaxID=118510 RepID=A0A6L2J355_TANCI|nr:RNA-directed DNA polymerase, eukaryota [Tanacetum cinerariifolium]